MTVYNMIEFLMDYSSSIVDNTSKVRIYNSDTEEITEYSEYYDAQDGEYADRDCYSFDVENDRSRQEWFIVTLNI